MDEQGREPVEELTLEPVAVVRRNHPRALWGVLALVALAAGALVVTSSDGEGGQRPGLPVELALGGNGAGRAEAAADAMLAWVTYVAGDDLPSLGGEGTAYRLSGDVDEGRVRALADALGLEGEVRRNEGGWSITGEGGLGRLDIYGGGGAYWSYFGGHQGCVTEDGSIGGCSGEEECVRKGDVTECSFEGTGTAIAGSPGDPGEVTTTSIECPSVPPATADNEVILCAEGPDTGSDCGQDDCIVPDVAPGEPASPRLEPREAVPPPDDVAQVALGVVAASGLDIDDAIVSGLQMGGDDASGPWQVTVEPRLDGVPSGLLSSIEVGSDGSVLSGNGVLGEIEDLGEYPLLDTRAAIDRANEIGAAPMPGVAARDAVSSSESGAASGGGGSSGAGGTAGCTDEDCATDPGEPTDTTFNPCKVQPDGREICEVEGTTGGEVPTTTVVDPCEVDQPQATTTIPCFPDCPQDIAVDDTGDIAVGAPEDVRCTPPPIPEPIPVPEPEPVEIVLVDAEHSLVLLPASDGSGDGYLVPAYRFTADDGGQVDLPAVADEALTGTPSTDTSVPDTVLPPPEPVPEPQPCEVLEEQDPESGTTHTVLTCPTPNEDPPSAGAHQVEASVMDGHCTWLVVRIADRIWWTPGYYENDLYGWSQPTEPGTFTINEDGTGEFVADADPEHRATLELWEGGPEGPLCD